MKHPHPNIAAGAVRVTPELVEAAQNQIADLREQAARSKDMINGLALLRDGVDRLVPIPASMSLPLPPSPLEDFRSGVADAGEGIHLLLTAWGRKLQAERNFLTRQADLYERNLKAAQSGIVIPQ